MYIEIVDLENLASKVEKYEAQTLRGKVEQMLLIIPEESKQKCFELLSTLPKIEKKWSIKKSDRLVLVQLVTEDIVTSVNITKTRVYESRLISLEEPDPRKIAIIKKKILDTQSGKLRGTPIAILKENLQKAKEVSMRTTLENKIKKDYQGSEAQNLLENLSKVTKVLITNYETAPQKLRVTWKSLDGKPFSKTLSSGISIIFDSPNKKSSQGWIGNIVNCAKEQNAFVNGIYFPKEIETASPGISKTKIK